MNNNRQLEGEVLKLKGHDVNKHTSNSCQLEVQNTC